MLLPLYRQFAHLHRFEKVIVFPFSGAPVHAEFADYEALLGAADPDGFEYAPHDEDDPVAMCYTSGTTGRPKGVVYSHRSTVLHTLVASLGDFWGLRGTDVVLPVTPMFHANSWGMPYGAVMMGVKLVFPGPHLHPDDLLDLMQLEPPTLSLGVPTIWMSLIQAFDAAQAAGSPNHGRWKLPRGMRSLVGGAAVPEALIRAFDRHGIWILQGWGMTETSPVCTISYPRAELRDASADERYRRAAMAGVPVPLVDLRVRGDDGADQPWDGKSVGEIQVRGPFITGSYHEVPVEAGQVHRGRLAAHRRRGLGGRARLREDLRPHQGPDQVGRRVDQLGRPGERHHGAPGGGRSRGDRHPRREMERAAAGLRGAQARADARRRSEFNAHLLQHGFAKWQLPDATSSSTRCRARPPASSGR